MTVCRRFSKKCYRLCIIRRSCNHIYKERCDICQNSSKIRPIEFTLLYSYTMEISIVFSGVYICYDDSFFLVDVPKFNSVIVKPPVFKVLHLVRATEKLFFILYTLVYPSSGFSSPKIVAY